MRMPRRPSRRHSRRGTPREATGGVSRTYSLVGMMLTDSLLEAKVLSYPRGIGGLETVGDDVHFGSTTLIVWIIARHGLLVSGFRTGVGSGLICTFH